jgi:hypothetical protein
VGTNGILECKFLPETAPYTGSVGSHKIGAKVARGCWLLEREAHRTRGSVGSHKIGGKKVFPAVGRATTVTATAIAMCVLYAVASSNNALPKSVSILFFCNHLPAVFGGIHVGNGKRTVI